MLFTALPSTSPNPAGLERPEVAGVVQCSALSVQPEGEQVGNSTSTPDDQANLKRSRGRPQKTEQTSTSTSGSKRTRSANNDWPDWLPQDWQIITKTRKTGAGYHYKTYVSPDGSRCRSKPKVLKKLNQ
ncbi:hypothetical protein M0R45_015256 [Rubus argutus]|uniref:MBD domain-containing protein n=1 Tax=Rubus argutus TaxID=59490 RepID=A0AAW1XQ39_RUBAR